MSEPGPSPIDDLFSQLRGTLGELAPEPLLRRMQPVIAGFLEQFQLVPRHDYDNHLALLSRLEARVVELEQRLDALESNP